MKVDGSYETNDVDYDQYTQAPRGTKWTDQVPDAGCDTLDHLRLGFWRPRCLGASPNQAFPIVVQINQRPASQTLEIHGNE